MEKEELKKMLKENLTIEVEDDWTEDCEGNIKPCHTIIVSFDGEKICETCSF